VRRLVAAACVLLLVSCSPFKVKWHDMTGQGRSQEQAEADSDACFAAAGIHTPKDERHLNADQQKATVAKIRACMIGRGWEVAKGDT
jgi:hypothetical protein